MPRVNKKKRSRLDQRWSSAALYSSNSSSEDDTTDLVVEPSPARTSRHFSTTTTSSKGNLCSSSQRDALTSSHSSLTRTLSETRTGTRGGVRGGVRAGGVVGSSCQLNPLGQREVPGPALVPEEGEGEEGEIDGCPVINNWLVDDLGESSHGGRRGRGRRDASVERESRALLGLSGGSSATGGSGLHKPRPTTKPTHRRKPASSAAASTSRSGSRRTLESNVMSGSLTTCNTDTGERTGRGRREGEGGGTGSTPILPSVAMIESSESDTEEEYRAWKKYQLTQTKTTDSPARDSHAHLAPTHPSIPSTPISSPSSYPASCPSPAHLRIRVRIENCTYLIPCPAMLDGRDTPISWLTAKASERYFSQRERRPSLELMLMDGASLCPTDAVTHVLRQDEMVVGVVKQWLAPPLAECYRKACVDAGRGEKHLCVRCVGDIAVIFEVEFESRREEELGTNFFRLSFGAKF